MSDKKRTPRPPAVTSACLFVGFSSALLLIYVIGWLTSWDSLELQDAHRDIAKAIGASDVALVSDVLRYALYVLVVVLVAGVVGALYAARGDRASRILITVVAAVTALLFVTSGGLLGLLPAVFAVVATVQIWGRDARHWFAVVNGRQIQHPAQSAPVRPITPVPPPPPAPGQQVSGQPLPVWQPPVDSNRRPSSVGTTALVTLIASGTALGGSLLYLLVYTVMPHDDLIEMQLDSPFMNMVDVTEADLRAALTTSAVFCSITAVLAVAAMLAVWSLMRRSTAGHTALFVCAVVTIIVGAISIVGIPWAAAAVWVVVLLRRRETLTWLRG